jgi:hypothetical protein
MAEFGRRVGVLAGVGFLTGADLNLTDIVELIFGSKDQPAFRKYARLIYCFGPRYGAYFSNMDRIIREGTESSSLGAVCGLRMVVAA